MRGEAVGIPTECNVSGAELYVEPGRRIFFLEQLAIENAGVEFRGGFGIGHGVSEVLDSGSVKREIASTRDASGQ